jgi:uncharacterized protein
MRKFLLCFCLLFSTVAVMCQQNEDSVWIRTNYIKKEYQVPMRDGIKLFTSVYMPKNPTGKNPILMMRTPYSCSPYGEENWRAYWNSHYAYYMKENFILVTQDVRGRFMSEGEFRDVRPYLANKKTNETDEASDTYDAIEWLIKNIPSNNGRVGVAGISYPGFYSTMAAMSGHPALKAVSPQAPVTDWFIGDDFHHNGAFFQMDAFAFYTGFGKPRLKPVSVGPEGYKFKTQDNYQFYMQPINGLTKLMGDSIAFWKDLMKHPTYDTFWQARNARAHVDVIPTGTATLVVGGLFDAEDCFGAWRTYEAIEKKAKNNNRLVMGPWYHGQWASNNGTFMGNVQFGSNTSTWYQENIEHPFFDHYLKDSGDDSKIPEASIFITGANEWKQFETWPPAASKDRELFFQPGNALSWTKPSTNKSFTEYISDPSKPVPYTEDVHLDRTREYMTDDQRFASRRPDVIVFETPVLDEDLTIAGTVLANLQASISTTDADFVVKVIDVFPEEFKYDTMGLYPMGGYQMLVRGEIMRGKFRKSFQTPVAFQPGSVETVKFALPDIAHTFKKGHKLMIQVQSSWFPLADRNPQKFMNIYQAGAADFQKSTIRLYHDAQHASSIVLPVLTR